MRPAKGCRRRPTLPRSLDRSTIGAVGLNDRVRDGNGCGPYALDASVLREDECGEDETTRVRRLGIAPRVFETADHLE